MINYLKCRCGGDSEIIERISPDYGIKVWYIKCKSCHISTDDYFSQEESIRAWNKVMEINKDYATIEGDGDLHYCGYCQGDLPEAWLEHYNYCPECKKIFKEPYEYN